MTTYLINPLDPLIVRDGRPFGPDPGASAKSLPFPFPSTVAGAVRTLAGTEDGRFNRSRIEAVKGIEIVGPLLVELPNNGIPTDLAPMLRVPAPGDALFVARGAAESDSTEEDAVLIAAGRAEGDNAPPSGIMRQWIAPARMAVPVQTDLPDGLRLAGVQKPLAGKPPRTLPAYWYWSRFAEWLENPVDGPIALDELGIPGPVSETRTHVSIDPGTQTADEGFLFQTSGLEFIQIPAKVHDTALDDIHCARQLALVIQTTAALAQTVHPVGGERRLAGWQACEAAWPTCPDTLCAQIVADAACRVILLTPAHFSTGYLPSALMSDFGLQAKLVSAVVQRPQVVSGWDMARKPKPGPKPTRKLAPAGSVYYLQFDDADEAAIRTFVNNVWFQNISDEPNDRRDGFGLAVVGMWDGCIRNMEVTHG